MNYFAKNSVNKMRIPSVDEWGDIDADFDVKSAWKIFGGKKNEDLFQEYYRDVLSRVSELRFMPCGVFCYYILGFRDFLMGGVYKQFSDADVASSFLDLIEYRLKSDCQCIECPWKELFTTVEWVAEHQTLFDAPITIYGDFKEKAMKIRSLIPN